MPVARLKRVLLLFLALLLGNADAHEFWLEPQQFIYSRGDVIRIRFRVGEQFTGENWKGNRDRVQQLQLHYADLTDDLSPLLSYRGGDSLQFTVFEEGTLLVTFQSTNSFLELEASAFEAYLQEDGLEDILHFRREHGETDSAGREFYQRSVKTLLQVGAVKTHTYKKKTTLPLDIIALDPPYGLQREDTLRFQVLFRNKVLPGVKMRFWHRLAGSVTDTSLRTDDNGLVAFPIQPTGEWMLSCVHMIRLEDDPKAQWQSFWGSLTWGYTGKNLPSETSR
ncbi:MAG TPA: DUF4198 domain-containing protein [Lacibacter sp.]|nr:DUF4198 domain-containing protein [Lacibacter sp.]HMO87689.1 DUF4198 domain-containing protein [Lacibacter sp.]HMP87958.1 DUF4198 domain-containing protein [Lacibacter sp.]